MKSAAIAVMCKAPRPGQTKTRLASIIGAQRAAELSACFLRDVASAIESIPARIGRMAYGVYAPAGAEVELRRTLPPSFELLLQADQDFGKLLFNAARYLLSRHDCVLLINSDSPTLPPAFLIDAIEILRNPGERLVLGPACDGGYYLIGLKTPHPHLFAEIPWGTERVCAMTIERAATIGLEVALLPQWYDVDDAESLRWLQDELAGHSSRFAGGGTASETRAFLATDVDAAE